MPWAGDMGRRSVPTAGIDRVSWLQLVIDVVMDGYGPGQIDRHHAWPRGTAQGVLREALGRYGQGRDGLGENVGKGVSIPWTTAVRLTERCWL